MKFDWAKKVLIVDYDGVLVNFTQAFDLFMFDKGIQIINLNSYDVAFRYNADKKTVYGEMHNFVHSEDFRFMPPLVKAQSNIRRLRDDGWVFHCITAAPAERLQDRIYNAEELYGTGIFQRIHCIGLNNCKRKYLEKYAGSGCFWLEDKPENALLGLDYGLRPILMHHSYNSDFEHKDVFRARDWDDVYACINSKKFTDLF